MVKGNVRFFLWIIWIVLSWQLSSAYLYCAIDEDVKFIVKNWNAQDTNTNTSKVGFWRVEVSEQKMFFLGLFHLYKRVISSQDKDSCIFTVSCSNYALQSIKNCGIFRGILIASDRLQRCHSMAKNYYLLDAKTNRAIDLQPQDYVVGESSKEK